MAALERAGKRDIAVIDYLGTDEKWKNIAKRELAACVHPDDTDAFLERHRERISAIIHMGAISSTTETDADLIARTNFTLSLKLWDFCAAAGIPFMYASSAATYGDGSLGFDDTDTQEHLNALRPLNCYGWSKAVFDRKVARERDEFRPTPPQYAGHKFFNVYGPNEYHKGIMKSVIAHIFPIAKQNEEVKLFKSYHPDYRDGWQLRDFVWVGVLRCARRCANGIHPSAGRTATTCRARRVFASLIPTCTASAWQTRSCAAMRTPIPHRSARCGRKRSATSCARCARNIAS